MNTSGSTKSVDLKPCPFCGGAAKVLHNTGNGHGYWFVSCLPCDAEGSPRESAAEAAAAWNERLAPEQAPATDTSVLARECDRYAAHLTSRNAMLDAADLFARCAIALRQPDEPEAPPCRRCDGSGTIQVPDEAGPDAYPVDIDCPCCKGTGEPAAWQPIETAPQGVTILVYNPFMGVYASNSEWCKGYWLALSAGDLTGRWFPVPTHWMPLPNAPTKEAKP